jgi:hypothetical protein
VRAVRLVDDDAADARDLTAHGIRVVRPAQTGAAAEVAL